MTFLTELEKLQSQLSKGKIKINAPCGAEPIVELLGGVSAREQINISAMKTLYPGTEKEFELIKQLVGSLSNPRVDRQPK